MADFYPFIFMAALGATIGGGAYFCGLLIGQNQGYDRGFIAARLKFEIPRESNGRFRKK